MADETFYISPLFSFFFFFFCLQGYKAEVFHHNQLYETADEKIKKGTQNSFYIIVSPKVRQASNNFTDKSFYESFVLFYLSGGKPLLRIPGAI